MHSHCGLSCCCAIIILIIILVVACTHSCLNRRLAHLEMMACARHHRMHPMGCMCPDCVARRSHPMGCTCPMCAPLRAQPAT
jgi:hypothetical protein